MRLWARQERPHLTPSVHWANLGQSPWPLPSMCAQITSRAFLPATIFWGRAGVPEPHPPRDPNLSPSLGLQGARGI